MKQGINQYRKTETLGKSQLELLLMVYDGCIQAIKDAEKSFAESQRTIGREKIDRALAFMRHLYTTLDANKGGEVATRLSALYVFVIEQLQVVSATGDTKLLGELESIVTNLRDGWKALAADAKTATSKPPVTVTPGN